MSTVQTPVDIGKVIQNAVVFDFKNWSASPMNTDSLPQTIHDLFEMLEQRHIDYVLVGGVALLTYVEGRNTQDIDLIMAFSSLRELPEIIVSSRDLYFARGEFEGLQIDILLTENPLFDKVRHNYTTTRHFQEQDIPTATVEGLLLLKLYALPSLYRQGSFSRVGIYENDIATLLHEYPVVMQDLQQELSRHLSESDMVEVQNIVAEIQHRIERYQKGSAEPSSGKVVSGLRCPRWRRPTAQLPIAISDDLHYNRPQIQPPFPRPVSTPSASRSMNIFRYPQCSHRSLQSVRSKLSLDC